MSSNKTSSPGLDWAPPATSTDSPYGILNGSLTNMSSNHSQTNCEKTKQSVNMSSLSETSSNHSSGLSGGNLSDRSFPVLSHISPFQGASSDGIDTPDQSRVMRFNVEDVQEHIKTWAGKRPKFKFKGIEDLKKAAEDGLLRNGQIIFEEVKLSHHEGIDDSFQGWMYDVLTPLLTSLKTRQRRNMAYFHAAIYIGKYSEDHMVIENGGHDGTGIGKIKAKNFEDAFSKKSSFFVCSPPKDVYGKSTRYFVSQKALASLDIRYEYHMKAVSCETYITALLGDIDDDSFVPIQNAVLRSHKKDLPDEKAKIKQMEHIKKYKIFHTDLKEQIKKVPEGIILSYPYYKNRPNRGLVPWFDQMISSYNKLFEAASLGDTKTCLSLANMGLILGSTNEEGLTILSLAAEKGHTETCTALLDQCEVDVNQKNCDKTTALIVASKEGYSEICRLLIDKKAQLSYGDENGRNALIHASRNGHYSACEILVRFLDGMLDYQDDYGSTALIGATIFGHYSICDLLIKSGADVGKTNFGYKTAFIYAASFGFLTICELLIKAQPDLSVHNGHIAYIAASKGGHRDICTLLNQAGVTEKEAFDRETIIERDVEQVLELSPSDSVSARAFFEQRSHKSHRLVDNRRHSSSSLLTIHNSSRSVPYRIPWPSRNNVNVNTTTSSLEGSTSPMFLRPQEPMETGAPSHETSL